MKNLGKHRTIIQWFSYFTADIILRDVLVDLALSNIPADYQVCGIFEGDVLDINSISCLRPTTARFVKLSSAYRMDILEIEVIGH